MADTILELKNAGDSLVVKAHASQSDSLQKWTDSAGVVHIEVKEDGQLHLDNRIYLHGSISAGAVGQEYNELMNIQDPDASYQLLVAKGNLPVASDYIEAWCGEDLTGAFGKGILLKHVKATSEWRVGFTTSGVLDGSEVWNLIVHKDRVEVPTRLLGKQGADVASANDMTLSSGNYFDITGATQINAIRELDWTAGSVVVLQFDSNPLVKHNTAGGVGYAPLRLAGAGDFQAAAGDTLTLGYDGAYWRETSRTVM